MILKGSQRSGGSRLAAHLMNTADNDHITVHEVRGFVAQSLHGAFNEADAISRATNCRKYLFSLSFNPPGDAVVSVEDFQNAIERAETKLGLSGQPRAIVFHEKEGRRHAHAVWSRIDAQTMKAVNMPFFKLRLQDLSKDLYLENGWELPRGFRDNQRNPLSYTLAEFQQARRIGIDDPREIKAVFHEAFVGADSLTAFKSALEDSGYYVCKGDRRGLIAVDLNGKVYSLARWTGVRTKELRAKFPDSGNLSTVSDTQEMVKRNLSQKMRGFMAEQREQFKQDMRPLMAEKKALVANQRIERAKLKRAQVMRHRQESKARAARYRTGLMGVVDLLFGKKNAIRKENEAHLKKCRKRDAAEREAQFHHQHKARKALQVRIAAMRVNEVSKRKKLTNKMADVLNITREMKHAPERGQRTRDNERDYSLNLSL